MDTRAGHQLGAQEISAKMSAHTPLFRLLLQLEFRQSSEYSISVPWPPEPRQPNGRALHLWRMNESEKAVRSNGRQLDQLLKRGRQPAHVERSPTFERRSLCKRRCAPA